MVRKPCCLALLSLLFLSARTAMAGGSGLNTVVVVNQVSSNSVALGNYYCEKRGLPPQNVLRISWPGSNDLWTLDEFNAYLRNPLQVMLATRGLTNQIDFAVLSMDIPFRVQKSGTAFTGGVNSTTSALYYGFKADESDGGPWPGCTLPAASSNTYAGSEGLFRSRYPAVPGEVPLMATMITATNLALAKAIVDQGVAGDSTFPTQTVVLGKSTDGFRNIRHFAFDDALFNARLQGSPSMLSADSNGPLGMRDLLGYQNGLYAFQIDSGTFAPGAMADSLTSYGGLILVPNDHTTVLEFLRAGATASYGTVVEPCAYLEKFPSPNNYYFQARAFNIAESYYQSVTNPYQGLLVGEPLSTPFAKRAQATWLSPASKSIIQGATNLTLQFVSGSEGRPIDKVDLFLNGGLVRTLTNIPPSAGNSITINVNGHSLDYTVPSGATLESITSALVQMLNGQAFRNLTKVAATAHGDRLELQSTDISKTAAELALSASSSAGSAPALTTFISGRANGFLETQAHGFRTYSVEKDPSLGSYLQLSITKTNGLTYVIGVTNDVTGIKIGSFVQDLLYLVNTHPGLEGPDGVTATDVVDYSPYGLAQVEFTLKPSSTGWLASGIRVAFSGSSDLIRKPSGEQSLDQNLPFLRPRAHLYLTAGVTNLPLVFGLDTTTLPNGWHEVSAVAYEGSHVRTQSRASGIFQVQNGTLSASFARIGAGTNAALNQALQFSVIANTASVTRIELFSTGGALTNVAGLPSALFAVSGTSLGTGLHQFYAVVTSTDGKQYRTETLWIRLEADFRVDFKGWPPALTWPAISGQVYTIHSTTNLASPFQQRASVIATNSTVSWTDPAPGGTQRFYRVQVGN